MTTIPLTPQDADRSSGSVLDDYDFDLPDAQVAQHAVEPRDAARLLVVGRGAGVIAHSTVADAARWLPPRALMVVNDTRVVPARLRGHKRDSGGAVELLLTEPFGDAGDGLSDQPALARSSKALRPGQIVDLSGGGSAIVRANAGDGIVRVDLHGFEDLRALLARCGSLPLPPYLRAGVEDEAGSDRQRYQTTWAQRDGAVAAPTAGLHFTPRLQEELESCGFRFVAVTLHVGPGTFLPVRVADIADHRVLPERFEVTAEAAAELQQARADGRPIVAVGTTSARVLETIAASGFAPSRGRTSLTLLPGHRFAGVDALWTNFHLPRSSLLLLLAAFAGQRCALDAYRVAVGHGYRFYSYGDASLWR